MSAAVATSANVYGAGYSQYKHSMPPPASRPSSSSSSASDTRLNFRLPRTLPRQAFPPPDVHQLARADTAMANVAPQDVMRHLDSVRTGLVAGALAMSPATPIPSTGLPPNVKLHYRETAQDAIIPSHMFAIANTNKSKATLYPCHHLLFAAQCTKLPALPPSRPQVIEGQVTLPVVSISLPSPETFPLVRDFLYTRGCDRFLASLMPSLSSKDIPQAGSGSSGIVPALSRALSQTLSTEKLMERAMMIHGVWANACALGVVDESLWRSMETAWAIVTGALVLSTGHSVFDDDA